MSFNLIVLLQTLCAYLSVCSLTIVQEWKKCVPRYETRTEVHSLPRVVLWKCSRKPLEIVAKSFSGDFFFNWISMFFFDMCVVWDFCASAFSFLRGSCVCKHYCWPNAIVQHVHVEHTCAASPGALTTIEDDDDDGDDSADNGGRRVYGDAHVRVALCCITLQCVHACLNGVVHALSFSLRKSLNLWHIIIMLTTWDA